MLKIYSRSRAREENIKVTKFHQKEKKEEEKNN